MIMKQYTTPEQTAKLIALGFEKPSPSFYRNGVTWIQCEGNYSIGELIEMLPNNLAMQREKDKWNVSIGNVTLVKTELIDALFELLTH